MILPLDTIILCTLLSLACWLIIAVFAFFKTSIPIYHPISLLLIYHLFGFIVRPLVLVSTGHSELWERIGIIPNSRELWFSTAVNCVALSTFFAAYILSARSASYWQPVRPIRIEIKHRKQFIATTVVLGMLGIYGTVSAFGGGGLTSVLGYETEFDARGAMVLVGISGYKTALSEFLPAILVLLFFVKPTRKIAIALIAVYVAYRMYVGSQRLAFISTLIGVYVIYMIGSNRRLPKAKHVAAAFILLAIFDFIGNDRLVLRKILAGEAGIATAITTYKEQRSHGAMMSDLSEFDVSSATIAVVSENKDFSFGTQYLRLLIWPIPRQLWQDKPVFTNRVDLNRYGDFRYLTTGLYADLYMNFGIVSVALGMAVFGWASAKLYNSAQNSSSAIMVMFFIIFVMYFKTIVRDGGVTVAYFWIFSLIPIIFLSRSLYVTRGEMAS